MSENQEVLGVSSSGRKRRPQQELHSYGEPAAKAACRRGSEYDFDTENPNGNNINSSDGMWSEDQHRDFVSSIFEIGLKNASPAVILENMTQKVESITSERVKSKLQKYRSSKNKEKSKEEFMRHYGDFLRKIQSIEARTMVDEIPGVDVDPVLSTLMEDLACNNPSQQPFLLSGDMAGYLTYCVMKENTRKEAKPSNGVAAMSSSGLPTNVLRKGAREYVDNYAGCRINFPVLTDVEKQSSLGIAMTFIAGLFLTMSQHLTRERARQETIGLKYSTPSTASSTLPLGPSNDDETRQNR